MPATIAVMKMHRTGEKARFRIFSATLDNSYPTGGYSLTPADFKLDVNIDLIQPMFAGGFVLSFDDATQKLMAYQQTDPADTGGADTPLVEVANATDLSSVLARGICYGN